MSLQPGFALPQRALDVDRSQISVHTWPTLLLDRKSTVLANIESTSSNFAFSALFITHVDVIAEREELSAKAGSRPTLNYA